MRLTPISDRLSDRLRVLTRAAFVLLLGALPALAAAAPADSTQTRVVRQGFPLTQGQTVRFANLAGRVDLVPGSGTEVVIEATVHAENGDDGAKLLAGMRWVKAHDKKGREEWALSYPVGRYRAYHYPQLKESDEIPAFLSFLDSSETTTTYLGEKVRVLSRKRLNTPTLYADLRIAIPAGGDLSGRLGVDTGSGSVRLASYTGNLSVDTGSGDVKLGAVKGETTIDTGSGDIGIGRLIGNGDFDTGSGDVTVERVAAGKLAIDTGSGDVRVREGTAGRVIAKTGSGDVEVLRIEVEDLTADTGSGDVVVRSSLARAKRLVIDTGSGDVRIAGGAEASFDIQSDQGSGELNVGYADATLRRDGRKVVGARRGDGHTEIRVETGSGDCTISPQVLAEKPETR